MIKAATTGICYILWAKYIFRIMQNNVNGEKM